MKKIVCLSMLLMFVVTFAGCESNSVSEETPVVELKDWGITFTATNVTATGLTIVCEQADGEQQGELQTGSSYLLEVYENDAWQDVPNLLGDGSSLDWTSEAYLIAFDDTTEWNVNWERLYGELPEGEYRISKSVMDFIETGNYENQTYYATFTIE